jgi:phosphoglycerate dehydrogenase-like enzyme
VKLVLQTIDNDGRLKLVPEFLTTPWRICVVDSSDDAAFAHALQDADALVSMAWTASYPAAPKLKLLQLPGAGTDAIAFEHVPNTAAVCNAFEHEIGISEYVVGAMLEWVIGFRTLDARFRQGDWTGSYVCGPIHRELFGKTLGIVGYGHIGREVAKRAKAFGMRILACGREARAGDEYCEYVSEETKLNELLGASDFVLIAIPLNDHTRDYINAARLKALKPGAVIINVARGAVIEEAALYAALKSRAIGGAILDVWYRYPQQGQNRGPAPWNHPFHELDNVMLTPHASGWTDGLMPRRSRVVAENLNRLARGEPFINLVRAPRAP